MSFATPNSRESKTINKLMKKIKLLLPTMVENSVQNVAVKQRVKEEVKEILRPTAKEMINVIHADITSVEKRMKAVESQLVNIHADNTKLKKALMKKCDSMSAQVKQACLKKKAVAGSISSLQQQITNLKTEAIAKTSLKEYDEVLKEVQMLKRKIIKIEDIENFQAFVSMVFEIC